jgi:WD40 repeat protein
LFADDLAEVLCVSVIWRPWCACCDFRCRILNILDASTGTIARAVESPHSRNIHCIALPRPSVHVPLSPDAYNLLLTSAIDNNINLWDLRAPSAVSVFNAYAKRRKPVGCDIPCLRYIATGSEDKTTVIYDIRAGKMLSKLTGARDVVRCVVFHPLLPQLAAGSYDGAVRFYSSGSWNSFIRRLSLTHSVLAQSYVHPKRSQYPDRMI